MSVLCVCDHHADDHEPACAVVDCGCRLFRTGFEEGLDVARVRQAIANVAKRHGVIKDPPPDMVLLRIYGYSAAPAEMDVEIAAEYAALGMGAADRLGEALG